MEERFAVGLISSTTASVSWTGSPDFTPSAAITSTPSPPDRTENPEYTRLTIVSTGDEYMKDQVVRQLYKLYDVKTVALLEQEHTLFAQHMFVKMHLTGTERGSSKHQVLELINEYGREGGGLRRRAPDRRDHRDQGKGGFLRGEDPQVRDPGVKQLREISPSGSGWDNTLSVAPREAEEDQPEP